MKNKRKRRKEKKKRKKNKEQRKKKKEKRYRVWLIINYATSFMIYPSSYNDLHNILAI